MRSTLQPDQVLLSSILSEIADIPGMPSAALMSLRQKIADHAFNIVVAGEFKRGKSTLINALLGEEVLPMGVIPLTSVITSLRYGEAALVDVKLANGETMHVPIERLTEFATERGNPSNNKRVQTVSVTFPSSWLKGGVRLVDTPGVGSVHEHNSAVTHQYLPQADAVIFVISADQPLSHNELDFLGQIRRYAGKIFFLLNKIDQLTTAERRESLAFTVDTVHQKVGLDLPVFAVSAKQALNAVLTDDSVLWAQSGVANFEQALRHFLLDESEHIWTDSVRRQLLQCLEERSLSTEVEMRSLQLPLAQLDDRLEAFSLKRKELSQTLENMDDLLRIDSQKLVKSHIEPDLAAFHQKLRTRVQALLSDWHIELQTHGSSALQAGLEERLVAEVREACEAWRAEEEAIANDLFEVICSRFWQRVQGHVDELLRYSSKLFDVPFDSVKTDALWTARSDFYYKFWEEPPTLRMLGHTLIRLIPASFSHRIILQHARQRADELIEMQSGRLRHDFEERVKKNMQNFTYEVAERVNATLTGIESAMSLGREARLLSATSIALHSQRLAIIQEKIGTVKFHLAELGKTSNA